MQDALIDALAELDDITRRLAALRRGLSEVIASEGHKGEPCIACSTHSYAPPNHVAPFCAQDEPPSRPA